MKKFIVEIFLIITVVVALVSFLDRLKKPGFARYMNKFPTEIEVVNLGTSHGYDFNYYNTSLKGLNANREGNTLYYDLQNYFYLKNNGLLADSAIIIIPVSYFAFGLDENRSDRGAESAFVDEFYFYLERNQIYDYSLKKEINLHQYNAQRNFKEQVRMPVSFKSNEETLSASKPIKKKQTHLEKLNSHAKGRAKHHFKLAQERDAELSAEYLMELIGDAKSSGYKPVLVTVPYYYLYNNGFQKAWLEKEYFDRLNNISAELDIPYLDYSHDERFENKAELFKDSDHLNKEGVKIFSAYILNDIMGN